VRWQRTGRCHICGPALPHRSQDQATAFAQAVSWRQDSGLRQEVVEDAQVVSENLLTLFSGQLEALVGEDPATAFTNLAEARDAYTSALQITATAGEKSLFDFLR
jgi:flagellin-like hook-associated protein FlgL